MLHSGERQVAPTRDGIRRDHVARYEWAAKRLRPAARPVPAARSRAAATTRIPAVIDIACGVGYGAHLLAQRRYSVLAVDNDPDALDYAARHYPHSRVTRLRADAAWFAVPPRGRYDAAVCFETIEHIADPLLMLRALAHAAPLLLASVPNEEVFPFRREDGRTYRFHHRHYTRAEFADLLDRAGWRIVEWWGQHGPDSEVERDVNGRTVIVVATRKKKSTTKVTKDTKKKPPRATARKESVPAGARRQDGTDLGALGDLGGEKPAPAASHAAAEKSSSVAPARAPSGLAGLGHVVILGLGPSVESYVDLVKRLGGRRAFADEVWAINALGDVVQCDRVFHMDDVRIQEIRAAAMPDSNIAHMLAWLKRHPGPIVTSRPHPAYPGLEPFPLEAVINDLGYAYFNSTAAYAAAYAIWRGARKISLFGCDYSYANAHSAEAGRACLEFWLGLAAARGIEIAIAERSSLMDACEPDDRKLYGYDTLEVAIAQASPGAPARVTFTPRERLPTAAEIEARYDHDRHPNPLVRAAKPEGPPRSGA